MARRGTNTKAVWAAGALAVTVLALTGYAMLNGGDDNSQAGKGDEESPSAGGSTGPKPSYTVPGDWTEPERWAALPKGARTDRYGSEVGFPHTEQGAEAMLAAANNTAAEDSTSLVDEQLRIFHSYITKDARTEQNAEKVELAAGQTDKELHRKFSLKPGSDLPSGAYVRNTVIGFKVIAKADDEVSAWLLARVTEKAGETAKESVTYTRTVVGIDWENGDWKLSGTVTSRAMQEIQGQAKPQMVAPGDAAFNQAGWTAIREAS
ncbi:hypothetical protein AQI88_29540 [Streptomyces cellostaticus]|uniref:DUF8175 domain-containing protein n=1 Tax=Streptomyces cellostaticus TaxID=67285 RepID=A0A101NGY0_9ACTN|nr:hypothetical protein [Streptomyces cellostaticus]KUM92892.1 hypothetical protein AQI88_29540 [Streptomyces cellostaticus]GHI04644.1 hypothetical protein Scel_29650 [Streptomyces cellostaticus]